MICRSILLGVLVSMLSLTAINAQSADTTKAKSVDKKWYDSFAIRGYLQVRYNRLLETNSKLKCE